MADHHRQPQSDRPDPQSKPRAQRQVFGEQCDDRWLWVKTGERWQVQELNAATAAKVDQYVAAVEAIAASSISGIRFFSAP
ncbi:hypothetical protein [Nonomuraea sp. NPDC003709]|uniref:hypothetical protein n=1 Tax=Nonomuraea sp. NPDC003709 TaxID=3154450 RepID=UPI0033AD444A